VDPTIRYHRPDIATLARLSTHIIDPCKVNRQLRLMMEARRDELTAEVTADDAPAPPPPAPEMDLVAKAEAIAKAREAGWTETTAFDYESFNRPAADGEYDGQAQAYEWKDEYGDVGPEVPALERILFGNEFQLREGRHRGAIDSFEVIVEGPVKPQPIGRVCVVPPPHLHTSLTLTIV
jgi:ATP-dependent RNA helicase DDX3X